MEDSSNRKKTTDYLSLADYVYINRPLEYNEVGDIRY